MRKAGKWLGTYNWPGAHLVWTKINLADVAARRSPQRQECSAPPTPLAKDFGYELAGDDRLAPVWDCGEECTCRSLNLFFYYKPKTNSKA
jgi:hypothetical protein